MIRTGLFILFLGILPFSLLSQDAKTIISKMHSTYSGNIYSYNVKYKLYKGHSTKEVHSIQSGQVLVNGTNYYQKVDQTEFINGNGFFLKISNEEQAMVLETEKKSDLLPVNIDEALKECSKQEVFDKEGYYVILLHIKESSQIPCTKVRLAVKKSDYTLRSLDMYFVYQQDFSTSYNSQDLQQPHLRLEFNEISFGGTPEKGVFELKSYLNTVNNILSPRGKYSGFELYDNRIK